MPKKTKHKIENSKVEKEKTEKSSAEESENNKKGNWSEDQKEKSYYYDDSYGYEIYNAEDDEE